MNRLVFWGFAGVSCASDVTIDPDNFYNFQTDVEIEGIKYPENFGPLRGQSAFNVTGKLQLNVASQATRISVGGHGEVAQSDHGEPSGLKAGETGHGVFFLDMNNRKAVVKAHSKIDAAQVQAGLEYEFCVSVDLPPLPPQANPFLRMHPPPAVWQRLEDQANQAPHEIEDGEVRYRFPPNAYDARWPTKTIDVDVTPDGIPVHFASFMACSEECEQHYPGFLDRSPETDVWFENWQKGAGDMEAPSCAEGASTDLSAFPQAVQAILAHDTVMQGFSEQATMGPLVLQQMQLNSMAKPTPEADVSSMVVAFVAGVSGAVMVLAAAGLFARKVQKSEPLLSEA